MDCEVDQSVNPHFIAQCSGEVIYFLSRSFRVGRLIDSLLLGDK